MVGSNTQVGTPTIAWVGTPGRRRSISLVSHPQLSQARTYPRRAFPTSAGTAAQAAYT